LTRHRAAASVLVGRENQRLRLGPLDHLRHGVGPCRCRDADTAVSALAFLHSLHQDIDRLRWSPLGSRARRGLQQLAALEFLRASRPGGRNRSPLNSGAFISCCKPRRPSSPWRKISSPRRDAEVFREARSGSGYRRPGSSSASASSAMPYGFERGGVGLLGFRHGSIGIQASGRKRPKAAFFTLLPSIRNP